MFVGRSLLLAASDLCAPVVASPRRPRAQPVVPAGHVLLLAVIVRSSAGAVTRRRPPAPTVSGCPDLRKRPRSEMSMTSVEAVRCPGRGLGEHRARTPPRIPPHRTVTASRREDRWQMMQAYPYPPVLDDGPNVVVGDVAVAVDVVDGQVWPPVTVLLSASRMHDRRRSRRGCWWRPTRFRSRRSRILV